MKLMSFLLLWCFTSVVAAADLSITHYPHARIVFQSSEMNDDYLLALGSYKKIAGLWRLDRQQRLEGQLTRYTIEMPNGHSASQGFEFYLNQIKQASRRELFYCEGRDCGTSNSWANNHFKVLQLFGLDQFQRYGAYEVTSAQGGTYYVSLYAVQRGNKRVYLQLDILFAGSSVDAGLDVPAGDISSTLESIRRALDAAGYFVFPAPVAADDAGELRLRIKPEQLAVWVELLSGDRDMVLAIVGHDYAPSSLAIQQQHALNYAEQLKAALVKAGVSENRLLTYGLGGLAPAGRGGAVARVELVRVYR